jgi:hypothetical protein
MFVDRRRLLLTAALLAVVSLGEGVARAEDVVVPVERQASLLARVAAYDRGLPARAQGTVRVLIVTNSDDADSRAVAAHMESALRRLDTIASLPYEVTTTPFAGGARLAETCRSSHIGIVYVTPGLDAAVADIARALDGVDVLTVAAQARFVAAGIVLGFDLVSGNPTLLINLTQARKQNVAIASEALHLMKVVG